MSAEESAKVRECLNLLQHAQNTINHAAQELCSVNGFADEWSALSKTYEAVKDAWYMVEHRRVVLQSQAKGEKS